MNPVRAGMVDQIAEYRWSSYHHNAQGIKDKLITEHSLYRDMGSNVTTRADKQGSGVRSPIAHDC